MATLSGKPGLRYSVPDWEIRNKLTSDTADHTRSTSERERQEGRTLRADTSCKTRWDESDSRRRLSDRIHELSHWKESLTSCAQAVNVEREVLTQVKEEAEGALAALVTPLGVTAECLVLRERRRGKELLRDPVEAALKKEAEVIGQAQRTLQQRISKAIQQLGLLQEARQQLTYDLDNKMEALDVDMSCLSLTVTSPEISLKPNPLRVPAGSTTPQQWELFSQHNVGRAQEEMGASLQLREEMCITMAQVQNELEAQRVAVDFVLRKRTHQLEQATDEMHWQMSSTKEEITELEQDILKLEEDLQAKMAPLKLVHTRLENRTMRSGVDLCQDQVQDGLVDEAKQLEATIMSLKQKLAQMQHSLQVLQQHHAQMGEDLSYKLEALSLEQRSQETRRGLLSSTQNQLTRGRVIESRRSHDLHF